MYQRKVGVDMLNAVKSVLLMFRELAPRTFYHHTDADQN